MSFEVQAPPTKGARHTGLLALGVILLFGGLAAGVILYVRAGSQYEDAVKDLQRAPVGCDTEFDFTGTGTFIFYIETKGAIGELDGSCDNADTDYDRTGEARPRVDLELTNDRGRPEDLDRSGDASYDKGGYVGSATREITLDEPGQYVLSVASDDSDFAIAVGRDPKSDFESAKTLAFIVAGVGVVLGLLFIALGLRRKPAPAGPAGYGQGGYAPTAAFPATAPGPSYTAPPTGPPPGPPGYSAPPTYAPPPGQPPQGPPPQTPSPPPWGTPLQ